MRNQPEGPPTIADYGAIGDLRTVALVSRWGSIDWCCLPRFDSGSVFAALLDPVRGGAWTLQPDEPFTAEQRYLHGTNVLETVYRTEDGEVQVLDFMPLGTDGSMPGPHAEIHRQVRGVGGTTRMRMTFMPRFEYASRSTRLERHRHGIFATDRTDQVVTVASAAPLDWTIDHGVASSVFEVTEAEARWVVLQHDEDEVRPVDRYESARKLETTTAFWRIWASRLRYHGPFRAQVERSALLLKLLTHAETGAIIAAPTTSLPEVVGGGRNWDYRFVWLRDAGFALAALAAVGQEAEADAFMRFLRKVCRHEGGGHLQIMYGVDGRRDLVERRLDHLAGYRGSRPVRVGNGAADQLQIDVYGEVLETADRWRRIHPMSEGTWRVLCGMVDWVAANWQRPDSSIWEVRGELRHYVFSKVMSWVALDRGVLMARELGLEAPLPAWSAAREAVRSDILSRGWLPELGAFVQAYGSDAVDAAALTIPMVGFLPWQDPRVVSTVRVIARELTSPDGELVFRYRGSDGLEGEEGAFSICTFWLAQALAGIGDRESAERIFRRMLRHSNHLGLYSEEIDPRSGEFLGNFPQAFTHIALINCAAALQG